jgi:uncharacterized protein (TIGR02145 family)
MKTKIPVIIYSAILLFVSGNCAVSQNYKDVKIGKQTWMGVNLNVDKFRNGDLIQEARTNEQWQEAADNKQPAWCYFNNNQGNNESYGKLYNWYAVNDPRGLAPIGYHLPSKGEWAQVINHLGGEANAGGKMKCTGTQYWTAPNSWATNTSGFSGRAGGARSENSLSSGGPFYPPLGIYGIWWSTTEAAQGMKEGNAITTQIYYTNPGIAFSESPKGDGYSVRCIKDFFLAGTKLEPEMIRVEGGTFIMGSESGNDSEKPPHEVTLSNFAISKYEITQAHWKLVMGSDDEISNKGCEKCPVDNVNWNRAQEFVQKLSAQTGKRYRLPTEAEWEYAARGGSKSGNYMFSGSNSIDAVAWHGGNSGGKAHPVGTKQANELGIFDMTGNVEEWCSDWSGSYAGEPAFDPLGPITCSQTPPSRVLRGGCKNTLSSGSRNTNRSGCYPWGLTFSGSCGLRVVREIKLEELDALNDTIRKLVRTDIDNKDYASAIEKMKSVFATNGTFIAWDYGVMGYCSVKLSDYENALKYYKTGLNKFPNLKSATDNLRSGYNSIGWNLILKKDFTSAVRYLKEGFDKYPSDLFIQGNLAHASLLSGDFQTAKKIYTENKGKNLNDTLSWVSMVNADFKDFQDAGIANDHFQEILDLMNN